MAAAIVPNPNLPPVRTRPQKRSSSPYQSPMGSTTTTTITTISSDGGGNLSSIDQSVESPAQSVISLQQPNVKRTNTSRPKKLFRQVRSIFRSLPIITTAACKFPTGNRIQDGQINGTRMTGTLFGHKKARVSLAIQDSSSSLPLLLLELGMPTGKLLQSMGNGMVRIAMECEKRSGKDHNKTKIADEPVWTMFCNGRKTGFGVRRDATEEDLRVMQTLRVISQGAGVIPEAAATEAADGGVHSNGELAYMRAHFERVVGSRDSETYYMMNPDGNSGPELSIFFVRV